MRLDLLSYFYYKINGECFLGYLVRLTHGRQHMESRGRNVDMSGQITGQNI